jgi:uroporphyrinogen-III decarboxylase
MTPTFPKMSQMTARERILAALNFKPVDQIPFVPLIDSYTLRDMPQEIIPNSFLPFFNHFQVIEASKALGCDLMVRHVPATLPFKSFSPHLQSYGEYKAPVDVKTELNGHELSEALITPVGNLTGKWEFTDMVGAIPHLVKYVVNNHEEMKIFHYAVDHLNPDSLLPDIDTFKNADEIIGADGIPTATLPMTPLMFLIYMVWGLENTYYLLYDHREEVEDILNKLHLSLKRLVQVIAEGPAQVVIQYENTSSTLLSPDIFCTYCLPFLNEYADILNQAGKTYLIHMCGKLSAFKDIISQGRYAGIADITPHSTGDLALDEAAASIPGKVFVGGIDPTVFVSQDPEYVRKEVSALIERIKPFRGVLLGSGDVTPRGTPVENFRIIRGLVDTLGVYGS